MTLIRLLGRARRMISNEGRKFNFPNPEKKENINLGELCVCVEEPEKY